MKFGYIEDKKSLDKIDYTLPEVPRSSINFLNSLSIAKSKELYVGASVWADKSFKNNLYLQKTSQTEYLKIFSNHFNCVEVNSTFYGIPEISTIQNWKNSVNSQFKFCPKVPKLISQRKNIEDMKLTFYKFLDAIYHFEENLGIIFLQLPQYFSTNNLSNLIRFLDFLPTNLNFAIELRNPSWFELNEEGKNFIEENLFKKLENKNISLVITDSLGKHIFCHQLFTAKNTMIRFSGNNLHDFDYERIKLWLERIKFLFERNLSSIFFMIHQPIKSNSYEILKFIQKNRN